MIMFGMDGNGKFREVETDQADILECGYVSLRLDIPEPPHWGIVAEYFPKKNSPPETVELMFPDTPFASLEDAREALETILMDGDEVENFIVRRDFSSRKKDCHEVHD